MPENAAWFWRQFQDWFHHYIWQCECQDSAKEALGPIVTLQTWLLGQTVLLFLSISQQRKPTSWIGWLFVMLAVFPLASLVSIIGASKTMRISSARVHYYDRNSVRLAQVTFVLGFLFLGVLAWNYSLGQLPGQAKPVALRITKAESYTFQRGSRSQEIKAGEVGVAVTIPIGKESRANPLEIEFHGIPKVLEGWRIITAKGYRIEDSKPVLVTDIPPVVLEAGKLDATIYWHQLDPDSNYELEVVLFNRGADIETARKTLLTPGAATVKAYVPQR